MVARKYTDFQWLQNVLRKAYPGWLIPQLLRKKSKKEGRGQKREQFLQMFLNQVLRNTEFVQNTFVQAFFLMKDESKWSRKMKEGE